MSGKFSKKTKRAQARAAGKAGKKKSNAALWIGLSILAALLVLAVVFLLTLTRGEGGPIPDETTEPAQITTEPTETAPVQIGDVEDVSIYLGNGMEITDIGKYTGVYMEDGTDEIVSGVLMIVVTNIGESDIQYAEIGLTSETGETASFTLSTLPSGESVVLLEKTRLPYDENIVFNNGAAENVAVFSEPLSLWEDSLKIQTAGGAINITNISDEDITGEIKIYYKNSSSDMLYGGITYLARIEGGLKAGELRQVMPAHFSAEGSTIMFVTVG